MDYVYRADKARGQKNLYDFGFQFGDWLALDGSTEQSTFGRTDNGYLCSVYYFASTRYVADAAKVLGLEEAAEYEARANAIKAAILAEYFTATGRLAIDTQTGYLAALKFGVYKEKQRIIDSLKDRMKKDLNRLKGGFVGSTMMNCVLAENGMVDKAYDLLFFEGFPGWLYAVNLGATTIWERWNSILPDTEPNITSYDHYAFGCVDAWVFANVAGIRPLEPGFRRIEIRPEPDTLPLEHCRRRFQCEYGNILVSWNTQTLKVSIPCGVSAVVQWWGQEFCVGSGDYVFGEEHGKEFQNEGTR